VVVTGVPLKSPTAALVPPAKTPAAFGALAPAILFALLASLGLVLHHASTGASVVSVAWALAVAALLYRISSSRRPAAWRTFYFASLAGFFLLGMHGGGTGEPVPCHIGMAGNLLQPLWAQWLALSNGTWVKYGALSLSVAWLAVLLAAGGGTCGWVCFFGGVDDALSRVPRKPLLRIPPSLKVREFQAALAVFLVAASFGWFEPVFCQWLCPFKETKGVLDETLAVFPVQRAVQFGVIGLFLVVLPLLTGKRAFCSALCPFGALPPLFHRLNPYRVTVRPEACVNCGKCAAACPSFAVEAGPKAHAVNRYCTLCLRCVEACPEGAIRPTLFGRRRSAVFPFVSMALGGALSMFYVPAGVMALVRLATSPW